MPETQALCRSYDALYKVQCTAKQNAQYKLYHVKKITLHLIITLIDAMNVVKTILSSSFTLVLEIAA